ncbi:hypothetical protein GCM10027090_09860 [Sinomonas soli]
MATAVGLLLAATGIAAPAQAAPVPATLTCPSPCYPNIRDYTGDGNPDLLALDAHGTLWIYPGDGDRGLKPRIKSATGWNYTMLIPVGPGYTGSDNINNGVFARDKAGNLWAIPGNGHGGWLKPSRISGGWNDMTSIISTVWGLMAIDRSGTLWRYPIRRLAKNPADGFLPRQRVAHGWAGRMLVSMKIGGDYPDFYVRYTDGTLWPYYDYRGKTIRRASYNLGNWFNKYTRIVSDGDFENVDGLLDLVATDSHGNLWFYPSIDVGTIGHRVKVGHSFTGLTIY